MESINRIRIFNHRESRAAINRANELSTRHTNHLEILLHLLVSCWRTQEPPAVAEGEQPSAPAVCPAARGWAPGQGNKRKSSRPGDGKLPLGVFARRWKKGGFLVLGATAAAAAGPPTNPSVRSARAVSQVAISTPASLSRRALGRTRYDVGLRTFSLASLRARSVCSSLRFRWIVPRYQLD